MKNPSYPTLLCRCAGPIIAVRLLKAGPLQAGSVVNRRHRIAKTKWSVLLWAVVAAVWCIDPRNCNAQSP
jgi:hypothetical protein